VAHLSIIKNILTSGEGESFWFLGVLATIKASSEQTQNAFALLEFFNWLEGFWESSLLSQIFFLCQND
jgi:hypothetical protein